MRKNKQLIFAERREIERMYNNEVRVAEIAEHLGRTSAAIYAELKRGYTGKLDANMKRAYSAELGQAVSQRNRIRCGRRRDAANDTDKAG